MYQASFTDEIRNIQLNMCSDREIREIQVGNRNIVFVLSGRKCFYNPLVKF